MNGRLIALDKRESLVDRAFDGELAIEIRRAVSLPSANEGATKVTGNGIGSGLQRLEDRRFLYGRGQYVSDIVSRGMWSAAFLRSAVPHARVKSINKPADLRDQIFTASDLQELEPIRSVSSLSGFQAADFPLLARHKVRYVGECLAVAIAPTRAEAEDLLEQVEVEYDELEPVVETSKARQQNSPLVHEEWSSNVVHRMTSSIMELLRRCFSESHALQCGYCTPGMLITAHDIVRRLPNASRERIRLELSGNLCRCTGYIGIINAIELALQRCRIVHAEKLSPLERATQ